MCVPAAVVCSNHVSYMDMAVHLHRSFSPFVARGDVVGAPFVGVFRQSPWLLEPRAPYEGPARWLVTALYVLHVSALYECCS